MIRTHKFCGKEYGIIAEAVDGVCCYNETLILANGVDMTANSTLTVIHEALHAIRPEMTERDVTEISNELNKFMRRLYTFKPK